MRVFLAPLIACTCMAQTAPWRGSLGVGISDSGGMLTVAVTHPSRIGMFIGYATAKRKDADLPPEADFPWVNYTNREWEKKNAYHAGIAFMVTKNVTFGLGYGSKKKTMYEYGASTASGIVFRRPAEDESTDGAMGIVDVGAAHGMGLQIVFGQFGGGLAVTYRF